MAESATLTSKAADGKLHEITIAKTGPDTGTVRLRSWANSADTGQPPASDNAYKLYRIRAADDGRRIACKATSGSFIDPAVSLEAEPAGAGGGAFVQLKIAGGLLGSYRYDVTDAELAAVTAFVIEARFPTL